MDATTVKRDRVAWLKGPTCQCMPPATKAARPWRLVLLGAPGVGKGTQAELIRDRLGACPLSTGDVFRPKSLPESELSPAINAALEYMRRGELWWCASGRNVCAAAEGSFSMAFPAPWPRPRRWPPCLRSST